MSNVNLLKTFQNSLVSFFDELIDMFPNVKDFILIRILIKDQIPSTQVMSYFVYVLENEEIMESIRKRDDHFFLNNVLFSKISKSDVFKNLWINELDDDNKKMIWSWVDSFMTITKKYVETS